MGHASSALRAAVESSGFDQLYWAAKLSMDPSQFNKYCNDKAPIGRSVLNKILVEFPERDQAAIAKGYAIDQIPEDYRNLVAIELRQPMVGEPRADILEGLPERAQEILRFLATQIHHRPVMDMLESFEAILRGK